ncbi:MAG: hypothetical protein WCA31_08115 [Acidimicrobiales bacterium]
MIIDELLVKLVDALDRDIELLGALRYRFIVLGALAGADQGASLPTAVREVELGFEALRINDLVRASVTARIAQALEFEATPRLDELAVRTDGAWSEILLERRQSLIFAVTTIQSLANALMTAMGRRVALAEDALAFLRGDRASTYHRTSSRGGLLVEGTI